MVSTMNPEAYLEMAETEAQHWWFVGRRCVLSTLISKFDLPVDAKILEIGSGTGGNLQMLATFGRVSALEMDATARSISAAKTQGYFDIRAGRCPDDIAFPGEKFNLICLFDVLEHIEEDVGTLMAIKKLLAYDGCILITVPAHSWLWGAHDEFLHHKRRYSERDLRLKIAAAGLAIDRISFFNTFLSPLVVIVRFMGRLFGNSSSVGNKKPCRAINWALCQLFSAECFWLAKRNFSFGISLLAILRLEK